MIIGLATPRPATSLEDGFDKIQRLLAEASARGARVVCFPEAYLPGLRGVGIKVLPYGPAEQAEVLRVAGQLARRYATGVILGMEKLTDRGRQITAYVFDPKGDIAGDQTKTQIDASEDQNYIPGNGRHLFEIDGLKFGIAICHEGWRYPETVRWAATRGAKIVFHPQHTGSDDEGIKLTHWGATSAPYYEKAMMCRGLENTIYFASVNYCLNCQESATSLIDPSGKCQAYLPYGQEGVLVQALDLDKATGLLAGRFAPERY